MTWIGRNSGRICLLKWLLVVMATLGCCQGFYVQTGDHQNALESLDSLESPLREESSDQIIQKREEEQEFPVYFQDMDGVYADDSHISATKRYLCRKYYVYNPVRGRCSPTPLAYRKGRRAGRSWGRYGKY